MSPLRPRFCSANLPNPCWSTLRRGLPSTCYWAEENRLNVSSHLSVAFAGGYPGLHKNPAEPKSRSPNLGTWPPKPKISSLTKIHDYALLRLEDVAMCTAAVSHLNFFIPKYSIFRQNDRIHAFLVPVSINRLTTCSVFFSAVKVSACFWTFPGQSGAELPIFICPWYPFDEP